MTLPARRPATYDDLVALPERLVSELVAGELHVSWRPAIPHAVGASALGAALLTRTQFGGGGPGGWWILDEPEIHLDEDLVVSDIAGWRTRDEGELDLRGRRKSTPKALPMRDATRDHQPSLPPSQLNSTVRPNQSAA